jgi:hypothetical protein
MNRALGCLASALLLAGCAGSGNFVAPSSDAWTFQQRAVTQSKDDLTITTAVPGAEETRALTGLDLYGQGIQPVWLRVENNGDRTYWLVHKSVDPDYFSPLEVAYRNRGPYSKEAFVAMERWFWESGIDRLIPPGQSIEGIIYTHLSPGMKGFNIEAVSTRDSVDMTFFIEMPGFRADYMDVRFVDLYRGDELITLQDPDLLGPAPGSAPCCSSSGDDDAAGLPFNLVLVGKAKTVQRALFRAGWSETSRDDPLTQDARQNFYRGRTPDGVFFKSRENGDDRQELRIWATPMRLDGLPVWWVQAVQDLAPGESVNIDPDIDASRNRAAQSFWYGQSLKMIGISTVVSPSSLETPAVTFTGAQYFTNGVRLILWLSDDPIPIDQVQSANRILKSSAGGGS